MTTKRISEEQKINIESYMEEAKRCGKSPVIIAWLEEWPLDEFWYNKFSSNDEAFLWKRWDQQKDNKNYYVALDLNPEYNYIPFIMVEESVHGKIVEEIYHITKDWDK